MVSKLALTHTPDPIQPTRRGPDPIRSTSRVLTLTDSRPLHCLYRTDAITLYCAVNMVSCGVVGAVFLYTAPASWLQDMRTLKYRIYRRPSVLTHWWLSGHRLNRIHTPHILKLCPTLLVSIALIGFRGGRRHGSCITGMYWWPSRRAVKMARVLIKARLSSPHPLDPIQAHPSI